MSGDGFLARDRPSECEDVRDGNEQLARNFAAQFDARQRRRERGIFLQRHVVLARSLDDAIGDLTAALRDDTRCAVTVVMQRDRELIASAALLSSGVARDAPENPNPIGRGSSCAHVQQSRRRAPESPAGMP